VRVMDVRGGGGLLHACMRPASMGVFYAMLVC
jgi:hypothetical protein